MHAWPQPPILSRSAEVQFAVKAMRAAVTVFRELAGPSKMESLTKHDRTPVTATDFAVQAAVTGLLAAAFPGEALLAEEDGARLRKDSPRGWIKEVVAAVRMVHADCDEEQVLKWLKQGDRRPEARFWALDPVDGTKGLLRGGQFAAVLALIQDGVPVLGALVCPRYRRFGRSGSLAIAVRGEGAWAASLEGGEWTRLAVSAVESPADGRLLRSVESGFTTNRTLSRLRRELAMIGPEVRMDSQVKYLALAAEEGDLLIRLPRHTGGRENIWDHAAGVLLVEAAGGLTSDLLGAPLDFGAGRQMSRNLGIIASNGRLHQPVLDALRRLGAEAWFEAPLSAGGSVS